MSILPKSMQDVLDNCFGGNKEKMCNAAEFFLKHNRPPEDLGSEYRKALGSRPRRPWWTSFLEHIGKPKPDKKKLKIFDVNSIDDLNFMRAHVKKGKSCFLSLKSCVFAMVSPFRNNGVGI